MNLSKALRAIISAWESLRMSPRGLKRERPIHLVPVPNAHLKEKEKEMRGEKQPRQWLRGPEAFLSLGESCTQTTPCLTLSLPNSSVLLPCFFKLQRECHSNQMPLSQFSNQYLQMVKPDRSVGVLGRTSFWACQTEGPARFKYLSWFMARSWAHCDWFN